MCSSDLVDLLVQDMHGLGMPACARLSRHLISKYFQEATQSVFPHAGRHCVLSGKATKCSGRQRMVAGKAETVMFMEKSNR